MNDDDQTEEPATDAGAWNRRALFRGGLGAGLGASLGGGAAAAAPRPRATYEDNIYTRMFGIRPVIGAFETSSGFGNSRVSPEVLQAMAEANEFYVDLHELNAAAGRRIAQIMGAEAATVVASSSCGMMLAAAACITGLDKAKARALPEVTWPKREILMQKGHRFPYDQAYRGAGGKIVTVDTREEMINAISERTAMIAGMAMVERDPQPGVMTCEELIAIGKAAKVPVHIDDAGEAPPRSKLTKYLALGADTVNVSGSKAIQGPGSTGILAGRKDLIEAAILNAAPNFSIGRPAKVGKDEIVGLMVALEQFVQRDEDAALARYTAMARYINDQLQGIPGLTSRLRRSPKGFDLVEFTWDQKIIPLSEGEVEDRLLNGTPRISYMPKIIYSYFCPTIVPMLLRPGEEVMVARRIRQFFLDEARAKG